MNDDFITITALPDIFGNNILFSTTLHSCRIPNNMDEIDNFICQKKLCPSIEFDSKYNQYINRLKNCDANAIKGYNELYERIINEGERLLGDYRHYLKTRLNRNSTKEEIYKVVISLAQNFQNIMIVR